MNGLGEKRMDRVMRLPEIATVLTYCTQLAPGTPSERVRMALMRHRDPKQTAKTYTDARMLPLKDAIGKLNFHRVESTTAGDSQRDSQTAVASGHFVSSSVTLPMLAECEKNARFTREKSLFVTPSHDGSKDGKWSERQDLNLSCSHIFPAARLRRYLRKAGSSVRLAARANASGASFSRSSKRRMCPRAAQ
jgi:hypothetical protein